MTQKLTDAMFTGTLASSKLTGAMGNNDGSALTGVGGDGATKSANDPATDTNPSGGVGTLWANHTSGELYVCTDATTDANVWFNVGSGTGDVQPWVEGASTNVYKIGGHNDSNGASNHIERIDVSSGTNSVDVADMAHAGGSMSCHSDNGHVNGYYAGGNQGTRTNQIEKFAYASESNASAVGTLSTSGRSNEGSESTTHGYVGSGGSPRTNIITKFAFASPTSDSSVGTLVSSRSSSGAGQSSSTHGYSCGGFDGAPNGQVINKYSHSSDGNATNAGNLTYGGYGMKGASSETHGYTSGGYITGSPPTWTYFNIIDRFAFASDGDASDWADLTYSPDSPGGANSTTHGFTFGGHAGGSFSNTINKWAMASQTNATDIGNLASARYSPGGLNY